tara:strand:+ start:1345 stop:2328 length:984 start_codon:yes stop_codon:yes gene_type:complete
MSKVNELETRRKKYVTNAEARETWVETHRCTCGKLIVDKLTQSQIKQMRIGNLPCECGELFRGSLIEATTDYEDLGHYDESASENLVLAIKKLFSKVEVNTTSRARIVEEALKLKIDPGLFVFKHHLCGRSGVTSSNWSNPISFSKEYQSRFKPHFRLNESRFTVIGRIFEEVIIQKLKIGRIGDYGGQYYVGSPFEQILGDIPTEVDAILSDDGIPLEIFTVGNFSKLKAVKLYRKLSQLAMQIRALGSEKGALLVLDRTTRDFAWVEINSESLIEWSEQIASNLNNISYYIEDYKTYWDKIIHLEEGIVRDYNQEEEIIQGGKWK